MSADYAVTPQISLSVFYAHAYGKTVVARFELRLLRVELQVPKASLGGVASYEIENQR